MIEINGRPHYTAEQAAKLLGYADKRPIIRKCKAGKIPCTRRLDGWWLVPVSWVQRRLNSTEVGHD
jgi:prophage antirepressor-like protein